MKKKKKKGYWLQIRIPDGILHEKIKYVAEQESRSVSNLLRFCIGTYIEEFEKRNGKIEIEVQEED